jgi:hypothetical protein
MKKYFKLLAISMLVMPVISFADLSDTVKLLGQVRSLEVVAGNLVDSNPSIRKTIESLYLSILESLKDELDLLLPKTTSVEFDQINSPLPHGTLQTISFKRYPVGTSSLINFNIETSTKFVGVLANGISINSINWEVADNFVVGRSYLISAFDRKNNLLGKSNIFFVSSSTPISPVPTPVVTPEPLSNEVGSSDINFGSIGYWSFDRFTDSCETKGGAVTNADGKIGSALGLDGMNSYCRLVNNRDKYYPKKFTIALWAKSAPTFSSGWNESNWFVSLRDVSGYNIGPIKGTKGVQFTILDDTNLTPVPNVVGTVTPDSITDWHHYAMTYDGSVANVYLDGVLMNSTKIAIQRNNSNDRDLYFGFDNVPGQPMGAGSLDEIRMYNRPMTACEIRFLAGKGCSGISSLPFGSNVAGLLLGI